MSKKTRPGNPAPYSITPTIPVIIRHNGTEVEIQAPVGALVAAGAIVGACYVASRLVGAMGDMEGLDYLGT